MDLKILHYLQSRSGFSGFGSPLDVLCAKRTRFTTYFLIWIYIITCPRCELISTFQDSVVHRVNAATKSGSSKNNEGAIGLIVGWYFPNSEWVTWSRLGIWIRRCAVATFPLRCRLLRSVAGKITLPCLPFWVILRSHFAFCLFLHSFF